MKKRIVCIALVVLMLAISLCSCVRSEERYDYDMSDYITLPTYKGYEVKFQLDDLQAAIDSHLLKYSTEYVVNRGDEIYVDVSFYPVEIMKGEDGTEYDYKGTKIEELSKKNFLITVGNGAIGSYVENTLLGANIGDVLEKKLPYENLKDVCGPEYEGQSLFVNVKIMNKAVKLGDVVSVAYTGYHINEDGSIKQENGKNVIFDESTDASFFVGSHLAIDDFEQNLVGMLMDPENKKQFYATFPEDYIEDDLKGKRVLFEVYVTDIYQAPIYDDEFVKTYFSTSGYQTVAEFEKALIDEYILATVFNHIYEECKISDYPKAEYNDLRDSLKEIAKIDGTTNIEEYVLKNHNMTLDAYIKSQLKMEMIYYSISKENDIYPTSEMLKNEKELLISHYKNYYVQYKGFTESQALEQSKAFVNALGEDYVYDNVMFTMVEEFIIRNATLVKVERTYESISEILAGKNQPVEK